VKSSAAMSGKGGRVQLQKHPRVKPPRSPIKVDSRGREHYQETVGQPRIELSEEEIGKLKGFIIAGTPLEECAQLLGVSTDTLTRHYIGKIKEARTDRNLRIRLKLFNLAMDGNVGALIWLSKQWCGMRDQVLLGEDPDNPFAGGGVKAPLIELVFVESDGDGRPKTIEGTAVKVLTDGKAS
jgi:hypothetical protein